MHRPNILLFTGAAIALYAVMLAYFNAGEILGALNRFDALYLIPVFFLISFSYAVKYFRWSFFVREARITVPGKNLFQIYLASLSMLITPGKVGDVLKSYLLKKKFGYSKRRTLPSVIMERITDLPALAILSSLGAYAVYPSPLLFVAPFAILAVFIFAAKNTAIFRMFLRLSKRNSRARKYSKKITGLYENVRRAATYSNLIAGSLIGIIGWAMEGLILYAVLGGLGAGAGVLLSISVYTISVIVGVLSFIPGGLGASEASMFGLLVIAGISKPDALAATIIFRALTLWMSLAIGSVALSRIERKSG